MKKNFIYFAITLLMGLFAACSQEEAPGASSSSNNLVNTFVTSNMWNWPRR